MRAHLTPHLTFNPMQKTRNTVICCCALGALLHTLKLIFSLDVKLSDTEKDEDAGTKGNNNKKRGQNQTTNSKKKNITNTKIKNTAAHVAKLPLTLVISEAATPEVVECLLNILRRGGVMQVEQYKLLLPSRAGVKERHHVVQLLCLGFDPTHFDVDGQDTHTKAQERRNLYSFLQNIRIDGTTPEGGCIWSWYDTDVDERSKNNNIVPSPDNPSSLLDICLKKNILTRTFFRHDAGKRDQLHQMWGELWSPIHMSEQLSKEACSYMGPEISLYFEFLIFYTRSLVIPSIIGIVLFLFGNDQDPRWWICLSVLMALWSSLFLGYWKIHKINRCNFWIHNNVGMYTNNSRIDDTSNLKSKYNKKNHIFWRRVASVLCSIILIVVVLRVDFYLLAWKTLNDQWILESNNQDIGFLMKTYYSMIPSISKAICISIFDKIFYNITLLQVNFEKHLNPVHKRNSHVLKLCLFHFVSNFLYLYYCKFFSLFHIIYYRVYSMKLGKNKLIRTE